MAECPPRVRAIRALARPPARRARDDRSPRARERTRSADAARARGGVAADRGRRRDRLCGADRRGRARVLQRHGHAHDDRRVAAARARRTDRSRGLRGPARDRHRGARGLRPRQAARVRGERPRARARLRPAARRGDPLCSAARDVRARGGGARALPDRPRHGDAGAPDRLGARARAHAHRAPDRRAARRADRAGDPRRARRRAARHRVRDRRRDRRQRAARGARDAQRRARAPASAARGGLRAQGGARAPAARHGRRRRSDARVRREARAGLEGPLTRSAPAAGVYWPPMVTAGATRSDRWLFGPLPDLLFGCGVLYAIAFAAYALAGPAIRSATPGSLLPLLILALSSPHYGGTLVRVYDQPRDRQAYALFALWATLALVVLFFVALRSTLLASILFTLYLTWSPWHYTGQNYGLSVMFLRGRGVTVTPGAKRWLYAAFLLSFLLTAIVSHLEIGSAYSPPAYSSQTGTFVPIGITRAGGDVVLPILGVGYLSSLVV